MTYWQAVALMRHPEDGRLTIEVVPIGKLVPNARVFEEVVARRCDWLVGRQRRRWSAKRAREIRRLRREFRELRWMQGEAVPQ